MTTALQRLQRALDGRYRIERELGHGGTAVVYLATDLRQPRTVALKVLRPDLASLVGPGRFLREIEISAQLNHPHILPLFDAGDADGLPWFVMPYIEGESLRQRLLREQQLPVPEALQITREVGEALAYAHAHGIVHRDIKPENILLSHGHALVADFGIARAVDAAGHHRLTETGMAIGTAEYMSPEQATGKSAVDARSDQYSLACVLYEMLVGGPPFMAPTSQAVLARQLVDPVPPIRTVRSSVPVAIEAAILAALAKSKADRFPTIEAFIEGLEGKRPSPSQPYPAAERPRRVPWTPLLLGGTAAAVVLVAGALLLQGRSPEDAPPPLDPNLVVVAPFDVLDREYQVWGEGMPTLLSGSLDGAGPMRAVPPSTVAQFWSGGRSDRASSITLARHTGAGLAIYGWLVSAGADSVRLTATLLDVAGGATTELEIREQRARVDRAADSLSIRIMRELGRTRPIAAVRSAGLGSSSGPALKAYLAGEQYFRRRRLDSAEMFYRRAVEIDSGFALAWHRRAQVRQLHTIESDDTIAVWAVRAGALNRGLPARDSLMVLADSLYRTLQPPESDPDVGNRHRRLYAVLEEATRRYPEDPEGWFLLGRAGLYTPRIPVNWAQTIAAMNQAIALDSGFAPTSYMADAAMIALHSGDVAAARRFLALLARDSTNLGMNAGRSRDGFGLARQMLADPRATLRRLQRWMDTASVEAFASAISMLRLWPDSAEAAVQLARAFLARPLPPNDSPLPGDAEVEANLALLFRGHLSEAFRTRRVPWWPPLLYAVALYGGAPPESMSVRFSNPPLGMPWWAMQRDTARLRNLVRWFDSAGRVATDIGGRRSNNWSAERARAYLLVAQGDTTQAISKLFAVIDSICWTCSYSAHITDIHTLAPLLWARGRDREAEPYLDWYNVTVPVVVLNVALTLQAARVAERLGNREKAIASYRRFARAWAYADPHLQPMVEEARAALRRLGAGGVWQEQ